MVPEQSVRMLKGRLLPPGDLSAPHPLHPGDQVMAQFQGNPKLAWYPGDATMQNVDGSWSIQYEDGDVEDLPVVSPASKLPCVKHRDGTPVQKQSKACAGSRGVGKYKSKRSARAPTTLRHTGIQFMRIDPPAEAALDERDNLAARIHFMYKEEKVRAGQVTLSEVKYVTLRDIVLQNDADSALMHQQALVDFMTHLYTSPPVSVHTMQHLLGTNIMAGWRGTDRDRVEKNFKVFMLTQEQEEARLFGEVL
jgi:hypothetical protein